MGKRQIAASLVCAGALTLLIACGGRIAPVATVTAQVKSAVAAVASAATSAGAPAVATTAATGAGNPTAAVATAARSAVAGDETVAAVVARNAATHDGPATYSLDTARATVITLNGDAIRVDGSGVTVDGSVATITAAGTYSISGSLADGQIVVNAPDKDRVKLILNGAAVSSATSAPIYVMEAKEAVIVLADGTSNSVSDGKSYVFADPAGDGPNAAVFSKSDLTITGGGSLTVAGNYNDGISSQDGLVIAGGTIAVTAADDGLRGRDYLAVKGGSITVSAGGDGLKSDNAEEATRGYITIESGVLDITAGGDAIAAQTDVTIAAGTIALSAGGGYQARIDQNTSAKGIKGLVSVVIDGGTLTVNAADDAIHSNGRIVINGGTFAISTGDDGMHADTSIKVNDGIVRISHCYEGIESELITINGGDIHLVSSDDGLNVAAGRDGSGTNALPAPGGRPGRGGGPGQDAFANTGNRYLYVNGGTIVVDAAGDGLDINGAVAMTAGVLIVNGPTMQMNGALDYDATFNMTGGFLVAAGSAGMAQAPGASSTQPSLLLNLNSSLPAGALLHIQSSDGKDLLTFQPTKQYQSIAFSSPALVRGSSYDVYTQGSSTGTAQDGLYQGGKYTPGTRYTSFTVSGSVTTIGGRTR